MGRQGGKRDGSGRPRIEDGSQKNVQIAFRVTEQQKKLILKNAGKKGLTVSQYLLSLALSDVKQ